MVNLKDLTYGELENKIVELGEPKYRAGQIFSWLYKDIKDFEDMKNIPNNLKDKLKKFSFISGAEIEDKYISKLDGTRKYLLRLSDGNFIESVLMKYSHGYTICVSSQVGCRMGCKFCASTLNGRTRDLTPGEISDQLLAVSKDAGVKISNIVMMGIGEPLDNFDNVLKFIENITNEKGLNIGMRHITVSTCGLAEKIRLLADKKLQLTLSVSLHASNDEIRSDIMPVNKKYHISELMQACDYYVSKTNRRISFEYTLISGVNDNLREAAELSALLKGKLCHVNLIPVNSVSETGFKRSSRERIDKFREYLELHGTPATVRREMGSDINAACGQLRNKKGISANDLM